MENTIKVVHIVAGDLDGGAARGAYWLHQGLKKLGVESIIFTDSEITYGDKTVISTTISKKDKLKRVIRENLDYLFIIPYLKRTKDLFSTGYFGVNIKNYSIIKEANIVHLHWINNGFINIKHLNTLNVPIVWTIRDMWPVTGGCHFADALNCDHYKTSCGNCKLLGSSRSNDLSSLIFRRKKKYFSNRITAVGISNWMTQKVKESSLFQTNKVLTIYNNIDINSFTPVNKYVAREILNLKNEKAVVLCGATRIDLSYKGLNKFLEAIKYLDPDKYLLVFFGKLNERIIHKSGFEFKSFGYLHDNVSLKLLYSAADIFVAPSIMEPFGKTLGEAMACETPVVCFDATGPKDIVDHKMNGYKAKAFDSKDLSEGIKWVISNNESNNLGKMAREKVLKKFSPSVVAAQYVKLYKSLLEND